MKKSKKGPVCRVRLIPPWNVRSWISGQRRPFFIFHIHQNEVRSRRSQNVGSFYKIKIFSSVGSVVVCHQRSNRIYCVTSGYKHDRLLQGNHISTYKELPEQLTSWHYRPSAMQLLLICSLVIALQTADSFFAPKVAHFQVRTTPKKSIETASKYVDYNGAKRLMTFPTSH